MITTAQLRAIGGARASDANMTSILASLERFAVPNGLDLAHHLAAYVSQLAHESGGFHYDKEVWGPTAAQKRYDTRTDLGNTAAADGDGKLYAGRAGIQITGKANYRAFTTWAKAIDPAAPDFVASPDLVNTDPWEGLVPIWFWTVGNSSAKSLNAYLDGDEPNLEQVTKRINGGLNGYADRLTLYARTALVLLGFAASDVGGFQKSVGLKVDGDAGPATRKALHGRLKALGSLAAPRVAEPVPQPAPPPIVAASDVLARLAVVEGRIAALEARAA